VRMTTGENVGMALVAVWSHRFRSALTILGIVIGITTVVTVGSLTSGLRRGIVTFFEEFGPDNIFLNRFDGDPSSPGTLKEQRRKPIDPEYAVLIKQSVRAVQDVCVELFVTSETAGLISAKVPGYETDNMFLSGFSGNAYQIQPKELKMGRVFGPAEDERAMRVAVIGPQIASALFPDGKPLGRTITVAGAEYEVIGVTKEAKGGFFGQNGQDSQVCIPLRTARARFPTEDRFIIVAKANPGMRQEAYEEIQALLRRVRRTPAGSENDFSLSTSEQIIQRLDGILKVVVAVSIALASLGLLVGGIGVMNIMLVSVTERTREIGVRKAIGARKSDIIVQFLTEAIALTGIGGILGILASVVVTLLVGTFVPQLPTQVPGWALLTGVGVSVGIGLFFGVWPALKAASLDPVDALRYE
jgi:putative ABC transport system permease protein